MKIKSLLIMIAFSLSTSIMGHADTIVPVDPPVADSSKLPEAYRDRLHNIAHTSAIMSASSTAANLAIGNKDDYTHLQSFAVLSNYLYELLDATLEGADGDSFMRVKRFLDVLAEAKKDAGQKDHSCFTWAKQFDAKQTKELALALAIAIIKEIVNEQADALVIKRIKGNEGQNRLVRRALRVALATLIEASLDTLQTVAKNKFLDGKDDWQEIGYDSALKAGLTTLITQITGELIRRGLEGQAKETEELNEAIVETEVATDATNTQDPENVEVFGAI